ncbi:MAG: hypothetical protein N0A16_04630 [Blastocatellia bacterium]|nr:hypothetical protein [Blastocatellia bacterium]MCS7156997.1 hypothetical protein [Blastocatellia bacterium]MCX7752198.1 hypothetical protein [Blastocatellia bacterium]MDW8167690.1 hypothetical protein [Acidobacteriota bacterium]MDW8256289.1 hypothetical protein [Acidobacteriota bacterium]
MAKCAKCSKQAARRDCPALGERICPLCCAQLRMLVLACPEPCPYLQDARRTIGERRLGQLLAHLSATGKGSLVEVLAHMSPLLAFLEKAIVDVQRQRFPDLADEEVLAGLENAIRTYETLERGIIYEYRSESPRVQAVTESLLKALERVEDDLAKRGTRIRKSDELACLRVLAESVRLMKDERETQAYLRVAALFQPYPKSEPRLIVVPE